MSAREMSLITIASSSLRSSFSRPYAIAPSPCSAAKPTTSGCSARRRQPAENLISGLQPDLGEDVRACVLELVRAAAGPDGSRRSPRPSAGRRSSGDSLSAGRDDRGRRYRDQDASERPGRASTFARRSTSPRRRARKRLRQCVAHTSRGAVADKRTPSIGSWVRRPRRAPADLATPGRAGTGNGGGARSANAAETDQARSSAGSGKTTNAALTAPGELALSGRNHRMPRSTSVRRLACVAGLKVHAVVHRRGDRDRACSRKSCRRSRASATPCREPGQRIGACGCDQVHIRALDKRQVADRSARSGRGSPRYAPRAGSASNSEVRTSAGDPGEPGLADEALARRSLDDSHGVTRLHGESRRLKRLVGRDTTCNADQEPQPRPPVQRSPVAGARPSGSGTSARPERPLRARSSGSSLSGTHDRRRELVNVPSPRLG